MNTIVNREYQPPHFDREWNKGNTCDVIVTIATPIFLTALGILATYFAFHPGISVVWLSSSCSIPLSLFVTGLFGIATLTVLIVQLARHKQLSQVFLKLKAPLRYILHPGGGDSVEGNVEFTTRDGVKLKGIWHFRDARFPTVIFFHGNSGILNAEQPERCSGITFNILNVEYRGYGASEGERAGPNQEMEAYLDAEAALKFVLDQGIALEQVIAYGYSLGGAYAASLARFYGVQTLILEHTFTNFTDVAVNLAWYLPSPLVRLVTRRIHLSDRAPSLLEGGEELKTDGFDTLSKLQGYRGRVLVIEADEDRLIPAGSGARLANAVAGSTLLTVQGSHNGAIWEQNAVRTFHNFLLRVD